MELEKQMQMKATENTPASTDLTPPIPPLSFSLYDSFLSSHCSSCFLPLSSSPSQTLTLTLTTTFLNYHNNGVCSSPFSLSLLFSSSEHHLFSLLSSSPSLFPFPDTSDLRSSLRLLLSLSSSPNPNPNPRLLNLLTNRDKLLQNQNDDVLERVKAGARVMAMARAMREEREFRGDCEIEESVLCLVITNAVEISVDNERPIGIGVYDWRFSWINHSCSPNSCFRFVSAFEEFDRGSDKLLIRPCGEVQVEGGDGDGGGCSTSNGVAEGEGNYGPRVIVRSIKGIECGEEVTVTYTDLLQPKALRQSELLLKYQFICNCKRCSAVPQTYVDYALEETIVSHNSPRSVDKHNKEDVEELRDVLDSIIMEYMEEGNPVSCCEKIEALLSHGVCNHFRLSPIHHLSLSVYTTLDSTYKIRARESIDEKPLQSFDMSRISAAYSLLLAGATHHLFLSEPSFIASAATFWVNAGESLLHLAWSSSWKLFPSCMPQNLSPVSNFRCPRCLLTDNFESNFSSQTPKRELDDVSRDFLMCISNVTPKVWSFLTQGCQYLKEIKDPIDFSWLGALGSSGDPVKRDDQELGNVSRTDILVLGVHCLLYGGYLSCICYGRHRYRAFSIRNVLCC